jgi:hypothetical protein
MVVIGLVLNTLIIFTISAGGCPKRSRNKYIGNSSTFIMNASSSLIAIAAFYIPD